jgi:hypothetical protein
MTEKIKLVRNDTRPALVCTISDQTTGQPINLTGCVVRLRFREAGASEVKAIVVGLISNSQGGQVIFYPASAPEMLADSSGDYEGEIEITFSDNTVQTVFDLLKFRVREDF